MKIKTLEKINIRTMDFCIIVDLIFVMLGAMGLPLPVYASVITAVTAICTIVETITWKKIKEYYSQENK